MIAPVMKRGELVTSADFAKSLGDGQWIELDMDGHGDFAVFRMEDDERSPECEAKVAFIVKACNSHDELMSALELLIALNVDQDETTLEAIAKAQAVLDKAGAA